VQVVPIKSKLKAPGSKRLKLKYDGLFSNFAFRFKLRRYTLGPGEVSWIINTKGNTGLVVGPKAGACRKLTRR